MLDAIDFRVIGERKAHPHQLLLLGDDGQCYAFDLTSGAVELMDLDGSWALDASAGRLRYSEVPAETRAP